MDKTHNSLFFKEKLSIKLNRDSDPMFIIFDYDKRTYSVNMDLQHYHDFYEIYVSLDSDVAHLVENSYHQMTRNDIIFLRPNRLHMSVYPKINSACKRIVINFNLASGIPGLEYEMSRLFKVFDMDIPIVRFPPDISSQIVGLLNEIFLIGTKKQNGWEIAYYAKFLEFLWTVSKNLSYNCYAEEKVVESTEQKIYYVVDYINTHYKENISLDSVAQEFAISPYYLSHLFKEITGTNFVNHVQMVRVRNVLQLLAYSEMSISDIIEECGFASSSQFNRVFQHYCGISPSSYRRSHSEKKALLMGCLNPAAEERAPANFPPRSRIKARLRLNKGEALKVGVRATDFGPMNPAVLKMRLSPFNIDTIQLSAYRSFPFMQSYLNMTPRDISFINEQGFDISVLECYTDLSASDDEKWEKGLDNFKAALKVASLLNASCVATGTGLLLENSGKQQFARVVEALRRLLPVAELYKIPIAVEPSFNSVIKNPDDIVHLLAAFDSDYLRLIFDPVALLQESAVNNTFSFFEDVIERFESFFMAMHLKDTLNGEMVPLGKGIMAKTYPHIAKILGVDIPLIIESESPDTLIENMAFIRKVFA